MLEYSEESLIVKLSVYVGIGALVLTLVFLVLAVSLRGVISSRTGRRQRVEDSWMPLMLRALREPVTETPPLRGRDGVLAIALWNRLVAGIEGEAVNRLRAFARQSGLDQLAHRVIERGRPADRLVGATFLGRLQDLRGVRALTDLTRSSELVVRAEAARALVRIDPQAGPVVVAPMIATWDDCHPAVAVAVLKDAPPHVVARAVGEEAVRTTEPSRQLRLLDVLATIRAPAGLETVRRILTATTEPEVMSHCLAAIREYRQPDDASLVRPFLDHPVAYVRVQAVSALGRLMGPGDEWRIAVALSDPDWWVRHRAASALLVSPRVPRQWIDLVAHTHPDPYARGALEHVMSEQEIRP